MKNLTKFVIGLAVGAFTMTGCSGLKKVSYEEFKEKALEAVENAREPKTIVLKDGELEIAVSEDGTLKLNGETISQEDESYIGAVLLVGIIVGMDVATFAATEMPDTEYYVGNGFKAVVTQEEEKLTYQWNKDGWITKCTTSTADDVVTVSYTF